MGTLKRKERDFKQREELILDTAFKMMLESGYIGLTIDRIAEEIEYSKGTIYLHFKSKEDILVALLGRDICHMRRVRDLIYDLDFRPREIMISMGVIGRAFDSFHPGIVEMQKALMERSVWEKASEENKDKVKTEIQAYGESNLKLINDAIGNNELELTILSPDEVSMGLLAMEMGMVNIATEVGDKEVIPGLGSVIGGAELDAQVKILHTFLDGLNWQPLFKNGNYYDVCEKVINKIDEEFPEIASKAREINHKVNRA